MTSLSLEEIALTLYVPQTPDASNTVTDAYAMNIGIDLSRVRRGLERTENATSFFDITTDGRTSYPGFQDGGNLRCS